ncbi:MAG: S46 family peptidase, partial [Daejeonella sp.]|uniref:S46 family peptidase n=1 Tax=Daejeonella sp. TaxID=2805397 RepID=UPI003C71F2BE
GGNSGSPVLNGNGELIGIAFDGNWEAMSGDIAFDKTYKRTISVDARFVLWCIDVLGGAKNIIAELDIRGNTLPMPKDKMIMKKTE